MSGTIVLPSVGEADNAATLFVEDKLREQEAQQAAAVAEAAESQPQEIYIGEFRISHYCPCEVCNGGYTGTATGAPLTPWHTIAVDPSVIKLNSQIRIDGYGTFQAQDTGGAIKGNRIDICVSSHKEAYKLGVVYKDVYIKA